MSRRDYQPGEHVPGTVYQVVRLIGGGGMGTVYDVEDTTIGKRYVLKTLHPQLGTREDLQRRMQNEARTLARLNHPNIVEVITAGVTSDEMRLPFYVMERLNGQSLRVVLDKKGQLELPHALHIAIDLLEALDHAHDKGVIHRDVKPDNIFLHRTAAGVTVTKLLDFGIVSLLDATSRETAGRFLGTLRYAAPEQLRGERPTQRMDVYAAGLVLFEMLAGRGPFDDEGEPHKVAQAHIHKTAPPLSSFAMVPRELDMLLAAALAKVPDARPRDAFSFAASLRNVKRAVVGSARLANESTENRATAASVMGPMWAAAPYVSVRQASPEGPFVISPVGAAPPGATPDVAQTAMARTTMAGMTPPTIGPTLASGQPPAGTSTTPETVDRVAETNSIAVATPRMGGPQGTEALGMASTMVSTMAAPPARAPAPAAATPAFAWPAEKPPSRSEEPHSLVVRAAPPRATGPLIVLAIGCALTGAAAVALFMMRYRTTTPHASAVTLAPRPTAALAASALPHAKPVLTMPAPVIPPPALQDSPAKPSTAAAAAASPTPSAPTRAHARVATPTPTSTSTATPTPAALDRPGPGF